MEALFKSLESMEKEGYGFALLLEDSSATSRFYSSRAMDEGLQLMLLEKSCSSNRQEQRPGAAKHEKNEPKTTYVLDLGNGQEVEQYFKNVFSMLRQLQCKAIAKAWIKVVEPKKKSRFPYMNGDLSKPYWWPSDVEHREPDHLRKPQRIRLMAAILSQLVPQRNDFKLLHTLKKSTMSMQFAKNSHHQNALDDAYKVCAALCLGQSTATALDLRGMSTKMPSKQPVPKNHVKMDPALEQFTLAGLSPESLTNDSRPGSKTFPYFCEHPKDTLASAITQFSNIHTELSLNNSLFGELGVSSSNCDAELTFSSETVSPRYFQNIN
ncbi:LANO_0C06854g1_1 [Lachancea nothofagi CBS 11611]|uniref:LANO_0C06854g1_1 n=1 Tax=Lachancea nothofagi CBS 11611 TaxID=1266666 RepID=A0A1G4J897_9SACH|nr:LANO_0C06854g1_1 [Lachancea nothofagi CBS 11611]